MEFLQDNLSLVIFVLVAASLWLVFRTRATQLTSASSLDGLLGDGQPAVLEFFGNT